VSRTGLLMSRIAVPDSGQAWHAGSPKILSAQLRLNSAQPCTATAHGPLKLAHGLLKLTHGLLKLTHGQLKLNHGPPKLNQIRILYFLVDLPSAIVGRNRSNGVSPIAIGSDEYSI
jgi:uncharacterized protein YhhL (DUF1145 family)